MDVIATLVKEVLAHAPAFPNASNPVSAGPRTRRVARITWGLANE